MNEDGVVRRKPVALVTGGGQAWAAPLQKHWHLPAISSSFQAGAPPFWKSGGGP